LIEALNTNVLKEIYGDKNVTGTLETGITVEATSDPAEPHVIVIEMILKGGIIKRIVIPNGVITEIGEINYTDEDAIGYEVTIEALPTNGNKTHTEYIVKGE
jgi:structural protein